MLKIIIKIAIMTAIYFSMCDEIQNIENEKRKKKNGK
jgi:hypothetical protein